MKKTIFSTFLFILFLLFISVGYLTFFGYETDRFNKIIQSEIKRSDKNIAIEFKKISILLDIKKLTVFVKFINPQITYLNVPIGLENLRTDIDLEPLLERKLGVKRVVITTKYLDLNNIKPILIQKGLVKDNLKNIKNARFQIRELELEFDKNLNLKKNFSVIGVINSADIKISKKYEVKNLISNFSFKNNNLYLNEMSLNLYDLSGKKNEFFDSKLLIEQVKKNYNIDLNFKTKKISNLFKIPLLNYSFSEDNITSLKSKFTINKNKNILFKNILLENSINKFKIKNLYLDKDYNLTNFDDIEVMTSLNDKVNNEFKVTNSDLIKVEGRIFDATLFIKELSKDSKNNKFLNSLSKNIEVNLNKVVKGANFPIKNFRLIGKINKGTFEKISAKSEFSDDEYLDISLKKRNKDKEKILEIYSDIATPLLTDYKFFEGLEGGNLTFVSRFNKTNSFNDLTVNNFKLNNAPTLAKILTLADLKGLTDALKGEGISFETLSIKYVSDTSTMTIDEIFMIGPSISILVEGYVEKKTGLISLRGTLVPAKALNKHLKKIPVIGDILVGDKIGEGVFGLSFKIKGLPNDLKTTVNPVKTLAPRFITRAVEAAKKNKAK